MLLQLPLRGHTNSRQLTFYEMHNATALHIPHIYIQPKPGDAQYDKLTKQGKESSSPTLSSRSKVVTSVVIQLGPVCSQPRAESDSSIGNWGLYRPPLDKWFTRSPKVDDVILVTLTPLGNPNHPPKAISLLVIMQLLMRLFSQRAKSRIFRGQCQGWILRWYHQGFLEWFHIPRQNPLWSSFYGTEE